MSTSQLRDCCLRSSYDVPQSPQHCSPTKYARVSRCSHGDVVMLFCSSFTQSERFLQTDQLIIRLQVVVVTIFIRMLMRNVFVNVFKSDAVIWWAAIFRIQRQSFHVPSYHPSVVMDSNFTQSRRLVRSHTRGLTGSPPQEAPLPMLTKKR